MYILESSAHGILSAYCSYSKLQLSVEGAEKSRQRISPFLRILSQLLKIFLEREIDLVKGCALRHQLADRLDHSQICSVVRTLFSYERIVSPGHQTACLSVALFEGDLVYHGLYRRPLVFAAERHKHRSCAYGRVESLGKAPL